MYSIQTDHDYRPYYPGDWAAPPVDTTISLTSSTRIPFFGSPVEFRHFDFVDVAIDC